jgi:hypothetical protein
MWGWLEPLLKVLIAWLERRAAMPDTIEDVKTPTDLRQRWADYLQRWVRDKDSRDRQQK